MELPIPKHLREIMTPVGEKNDEFLVAGKLKCKCGNENLKINLVGDDSSYEKHQVITLTEVNKGLFLIVKAYCDECQSEYLIFDNDFHGWNGFVCGGDNREMERPEAKTWNCDACNHSEHKMELTIYSEGKDDFVEEAGDEFAEDDWTEGFGSIVMKTECTSCGKTNPEWIAYETM